MDARKQILGQIKNSKFKNQRGMAKALGMSESQFSQSLRILSENFVDKLGEFGIKIDNSYNDSSVNQSIKAGDNVDKSNISNSTIHEHRSGTPDNITMVLIKTLQESNKYLRDQNQSLQEKVTYLEVINREKDENIRTVGVEARAKLGELLEQMKINFLHISDHDKRVAEIFDYIKLHDEGCRANHSVTHAENQKKKKTRRLK